MNNSLLKHFTPARLFLLLSLLLIFLFVNFIQTMPLSQNSLAFKEGRDMFDDFTNHVRYTFSRNIYAGNGPSGFGRRADRLFPPLAYIFYGSFKSVLGTDQSHFTMLWVFALWTTLLFSGAYMLVAFIHIRGETWEKVLFTFCIMCSAPLLYAAERANLVILSAVLCAFFLFHFHSEDPKLKEAALLALAFAAGLKLAPAVLGGLLLAEKRWKEAARTAVYGALFVFLPFWAFPEGGKNIPLWIENIIENGKIYLSEGVHAGVGPLGNWIGENIGTFGTLSGNETLYWVLFAVASAAILLVFFEKREWKKALLLTLPMLFFPKESGYYNLLYLLPAVILFCNSGERGGAACGFAVLFALICTPFRFDCLDILPPGFLPVLLLDILALFAVADSAWNVIQLHFQKKRSA